MSLLDNAPHGCQVHRMAFTRTPGGAGNLEIPAIILGSPTPVPCWVQNASHEEILEWEKRGQSVTHRCSFFRARPALQLGDEIHIVSGPGHTGSLLKFIALAERTAGFGLAYTAYCEIER